MVASSGIARRRVLLRSSWQAVNIGDIAHTFGLLRACARFAPEVEVWLWPMNIELGVREALARHFPEVPLVEGAWDATGQPTTPELARALATCDVLAHGSGPSVVAWKDLEAWRRLTGKPYVICGVTLDPTRGPEPESWEGGTLSALARNVAAAPLDRLTPPVNEVLRGARRVYCRDSLSRQYLHRLGLPREQTAFGPDATFACDVRDDETAGAYLAQAGLTAGTFLCVIPRLRWTPYYRFKSGFEENEHTARLDAINERTRHTDHAPLRDLITRWVTTTGRRALLCPEMTYQVQVAREELYEPLPPEIRAQVVWRDRYWLPDEAAAVYARAWAVVSLENHSPILALAQGTPSLMIRQPTDTIKGQMWPDLGFDDCFFEIEETTGAKLWDRLAAWLADYPAARHTAQTRHAAALAQVREMVMALAE
ncbi:MAG: polysaccharide pyruvyl transferase family protein [Candidatus Marinimicrobia bacterium]|nr:polysaccharide pyruvyl transferase family protein [Candidatus Neomarinimicrobiota bacterium]